MKSNLLKLISLLDAYTNIDGNINQTISGRLLMPTLKFWRNERALYDAVCCNYRIIFLHFFIGETMLETLLFYCSTRKCCGLEE